MESKHKRTQRDYGLAFKLSVVEQVKKDTGIDPLKKPLGRSSRKRSSRD